MLRNSLKSSSLVLKTRMSETKAPKEYFDENGNKISKNELKRRQKEEKMQQQKAEKLAKQSVNFIFL